MNWPRGAYRSGLRHVLGAASDSDLGFVPVRRGQTRPIDDDAPAEFEVGTAAATEDGDLAAILAMINAFQIADRRLGGGHLYEQVTKYLSGVVGPRLLDVPSGRPGGELFAAASALTDIAGWMAHDAGQDQQARQHFHSSFRLAAAAENAALSANACASMSHLAGQLGQADDAVRIANAGLDRAVTAAGTTQLVARLHALKARGLSIKGESAECEAALDDAGHALTGPGEDLADWLARFDEASLASEASLCFRQLGNLAAAESQANRVIELRASDRVRARAFAQLTLARVFLDAGRVEESAFVGAAVCDVVPALTSERVVARLDKLGRALAAHTAVPGVAAFLTAHRMVRMPAPTTGTGISWPV